MLFEKLSPFKHNKTDALLRWLAGSVIYLGYIKIAVMYKSLYQDSIDAPFAMTFYSFTSVFQ